MDKVDGNWAVFGVLVAVDEAAREWGDVASAERGGSCLGEDALGHGVSA